MLFQTPTSQSFELKFQYYIFYTEIHSDSTILNVDLNQRFELLLLVNVMGKVVLNLKNLYNLVLAYFLARNIL